MNHPMLKDLPREQVAHVGKALASPKRLEMLEMLARGEKAVETLAAALAIDRFGLRPIDKPTHPGPVERKAP